MKMKYLKKFNESTTNKPQKKFPNVQAIHVGYIEKLIRDAGMDPRKLSQSDLYISMVGGGKHKTKRDHTIYDYFFEKCRKTVFFPNFKDVDYQKQKQKGRFVDADIIYGESVFLIPKLHNVEKDQSDFIEKKMKFLNNMREILGEEKFKNMEKDLEDKVNYGISEYGWINPVLELLYNKLGKYYKNDTLSVWLPKDIDYNDNHWIGMDYPHKYNIVGDLSRPNGVYFLSELEKYIENKYGISDENFYDFIINNEYIEGRYWERVWSIDFQSDEKYNKIFPLKLSRGRNDEYGMLATENIKHILNIIEKDFSDDFVDTKYEGFPIYIDYFKEVPPKY